jgi:hypothetical protein
MFAYTREEDLARDKRDGRMCAGGLDLGRIACSRQSRAHGP